MRQILLLSLLLGTGGCQVVDYFTGKTPNVYLRKMEDHQFPDQRVEGIDYFADHSWGLKEPYITRYRQIAQFDPDPLVRAVAVRTLNRSRDAQATAIFIKALSDIDDQVRLEAAKALVNLPDNNAVPALLKIVAKADETQDVRIAAADALKHYKNLQVARTLVNLLNDRYFGVAWQARQTLNTLTGQQLGYDEQQWLEYLIGPNKPFG